MIKKTIKMMTIAFPAIQATAKKIIAKLNCEWLREIRENGAKFKEMTKPTFEELKKRVKDSIQATMNSLGTTVKRKITGKKRLLTMYNRD